MASRRWTLYIGVTSDLTNRVWQHKIKAFPEFSADYNCDCLVYFEQFEDIENAIAREKQLKGWRATRSCGSSSERIRSLETSQKIGSTPKISKPARRQF